MAWHPIARNLPRWSPTPEAAAWAAACAVKPHRAQLMKVDRLVRRLKREGVWGKLDSLFLFAAHHEQAARIDLTKPSRVATLHASPAFAQSRGFSFDGAASYLGTGFNPFAHAQRLTGTSGFHGLYQRTEDAINTACYGASLGSTRNISMFTRTTFGEVQAALNHAGSGATYSVPSSTGLSIYQRDGSTARIYRNGVQAGLSSPPSTGSVLVDLELFIGCRNSSSGAGSFRAYECSLWVAGGVMTAEQQLAFSQTVHRYLDEIGATV